MILVSLPPGARHYRSGRRIADQEVILSDFFSVGVSPVVNVVRA